MSLPSIYGQTQINCNSQWMFQQNYEKIEDTVSSNSTVCVCDANTCDNFVVNYPTGKTQFLQVTTTQNPARGQDFPLRYAQTFGELASSSSNRNYNFTVSSQLKQPIVGFGGAMTDSSAILINELPENMQDAILNTYFDQETGNGYSLIRTNMGGCDFSERVYTYLDTPNDFELETFQLAPEDLNLKIPFYKKINQINENISYYFAPWTAPSWMKTNNAPDGKGRLIDDPKYYTTWAKYFVKFIQAYEEFGLTFDHFSLQNEPLAGMYTYHEWQETGWNSTGENIFLNQYIIQELEKAGIFDKTIQVMDGQRVFLAEKYPYKALEGAEDAVNSGLVKGVAVAIHWYIDWLVDGLFDRSGYFETKTYQDLNAIYGKTGNFYILNTEACMPIYKYPPSRTAFDDLGNWFHGQRYSEDIIQDLNHYVAGWTDWNIVLDKSGGPNWAGNRHDAPIISDTDTQTYYKNPMFYHMGHFSKFLNKNYTVKTVNSNRKNSGLVKMTAAVKNDNSETVLVMLNNSFEDENINIQLDNGMYFQQVLEARSINTIVYNQ